MACQIKPETYKQFHLNYHVGQLKLTLKAKDTNPDARCSTSARDAASGRRTRTPAELDCRQGENNAQHQPESGFLAVHPIHPAHQPAHSSSVTSERRDDHRQRHRDRRLWLS